MYKSNKIELRYTSEAIDQACHHGYCDILKLWFEMYDAGFVLDYSDASIIQAIVNNHIDILRMWIDRSDLISDKI